MEGMVIKVLIVDDSSFMRRELRRIFETDPNLEVVDVAMDGNFALEKIKKFHPDVVTLDIEMSGLDGISTLKRIMIECPTPVLIVSALAGEGCLATLQALEYGAVDFAEKKSGTISLDIEKQRHLLIEKVKAVSKADLRKLSYKRKITGTSNYTINLKSTMFNGKLSDCNYIIAIGCSTGGPQSLYKLLPKLPADIEAAIMIIQHMPGNFTSSFADKLDAASSISVKEAEDGDILYNGHAYVAPGDYHMVIGDNGCIRICSEPYDTLHRPSVDVTFDSLATTFGRRTIGVLMTGMGKDGAQGLLRLKERGALTIAESEQSAIIYGMPKEAVLLGAASQVCTLDEIPLKLVEMVKELKNQTEKLKTKVNLKK